MLVLTMLAALSLSAILLGCAARSSKCDRTFPEMPARAHSFGFSVTLRRSTVVTRYVVNQFNNQED